MPFVLDNVPTTFIRMMDFILWFFRNSFTLIYLNETLIFNYTLKKHVQHIQQVMCTLRKQRLYTTIEKCLFDMQQIQY